MRRDAGALAKELARRASAYQAQVLLGIVYWTVIAITAIAVRLSGRRLLTSSFGSGRSHWLDRPRPTSLLEDLTRQF